MSEINEEQEIKTEEPVVATAGRPLKPIDEKLEDAVKRKHALEKKFSALDKNYDALYRQHRLLEEKYDKLQADYIDVKEVLTETEEEKTRLTEQAKRYNYKDRYPRNIRTHKIK